MCKKMFVAYIDFKQYCEKISEGYFLRVTSGRWELGTRAKNDPEDRNPNQIERGPA